MMKMVGSINRSAIIIMEIPNNIHMAKMANIHNDYVYDEEGKLIDRPVRELTENERKENADVL